MEKPRIVHVRATNFYGGPEKQILEHAGRSRNYEHAIVTFIDAGHENELLQRCKDTNIPVHAVRAGSPFSPSAIIKLRRIITALAPSVICSHGYRPSILLPLSTLGLKIPIAGFSRGFTGENRKVAFYELLERTMLPRLSAIVCVCEAQKRQLEESGVRAKRWWVVHNAVDTPPIPASTITSEALRKSLGIRADGALIVSAGRLSPEKGHKDLLQAISRIQSGKDKVHFVFCGDGPCRKSLEQEAIQLGISDRVRFPGHRRDIMEIYRIMDLLVLPSHTEGLPNAILEAFSFGKPVVATRVGGVPEVVADGRNGILVSPNRPDMLTEAISQCLASPDKMKSMGEEGRATVLSRFSFERQAELLESMYADMLSSASSGKMRQKAGAAS